MANRWQDLFRHLQQKGFDVYSPATKKGECTSPYIVLKSGGSTEHTFARSDVDLYDILCYVPESSYSKLETMIQNVKAAMKEIEPLFLPYGQQTPSFYDDGAKAHMISIIYKNYKHKL